MRKSIIIAIIWTLWSLTLKGQDIHFSQFNHFPVAMNPAQTGLFFGDIRVAGIYRNQWFSVPVNYHTAGIAADMKFWTNRRGTVNTSGGFILQFDRAGDSRFTAYQIGWNQALGIRMGREKRSTLQVGFYVGGLFRTMAWNQLKFDEQWNGDQYDPNIQSTENLNSQWINKLDIGTGIAYRWAKNRRNFFTIGLGMLHINRPQQSWFGQNDVRLNVRYSAQSRGQIKLSSRIDLVGDVVYQRQDTKQEIAFGLFPKIYVLQSGKSWMAVNAGLFYRVNDALWPMVGLDYNELTLNLSYDINLSRFQSATRSNGGFEISIIYTLERVKKMDNSYKYCPAFL